MHVQSDSLLLADIFENFHNKCIKTYKLDSVHFLSAPGLAWQPCLKMNEIKSKLLTDIDIAINGRKTIRGGICHAVHRYAKAHNKYMKDYNQNKDWSFVMYWDAIQKVNKIMKFNQKYSIYWYEYQIKNRSKKWLKEITFS